MPFGATSAVHAWERIGALLTAIIISVLGVVVFRYVDDFFGCEDLESLEHAVGCVVRVIRILLGKSSVANHKVEHGPRLVILGVDLRLSAVGFTCRPARSKLCKILKCIIEAISSEWLDCGDASKLAGRLQWACQHMFHRIGRAMLRPIYDHVYSGSAVLKPYVKDALIWWRDVLAFDLVQEHAWVKAGGRPVHLFCDAAGSPARVAAFAWCDGVIEYTDCEPPQELVTLFADRADKQIMGLELMSVALGLSTFASVCAQRRVIIHSDNTGAESALSSGRAKSFDHCHLVHGMWTQALLGQMNLWVTRVASEMNVADMPSREHYCVLNALKVVFFAMM
jgi:hypothetical protein